MTYYKIINDRMVFSTCKTIQTEEGVWVSNPDSQTIADCGWKVYVPPIVPPQPATEPDYSEVLQAVKKMLSTDTEELSDEDALDVAALFPTWKSKVGKEVAVGERLWYNEKLYKVVQAHTASEQWVPDHNPALYTEISIVEWPEWVQPTGAQDAYNSGDKVTHNDKHWISDVDANVWEPGAVGTESLWHEQEEQINNEEI
jgi:hypothetical protein